MGDLPHVVILGGGFAGLACAEGLGGHPVRVTVIDRTNYHLFVPLLYQVATAALSPADVAEPIRRILRRHRNVDVVMGEVVGVDRERREVALGDGGVVPYDRLIVATGSTYSYFGHDDWAAHAPGLKSIDDARRIRTRLLTAFERAEVTPDQALRRVMLTTVVIGGGPTGVELAGAVAELSRHTLTRDFKQVDASEARVLLVEAGPSLLPSFPESLGRYTRDCLAALGVTVLLGKPVERIDADGVVLDGQRLAAGTVVWAAGVRASPAAGWVGVAADRAGRIPVGPDLSVDGAPGVYALGDTAASLDEAGRPLPGLAQVAAQQGHYLGKALAAHLADGRPMPPFRFQNRGNTAIIGRHAAVFDFGGWRLRGRLAWLLWAFVHIYLLVGFEKRLRVSLQWLWRYLTYEHGSRLITDVAAPKTPAPVLRPG